MITAPVASPRTVAPTLAPCQYCTRRHQITYTGQLGWIRCRRHWQIVAVGTRLLPSPDMVGVS